MRANHSQSRQKNTLHGKTTAVLAEVGQILDHFGDQCQRPGCALVGILLHQVKERWRHDGGAQETQEQRRADQTLADVRPPAVAALLTPRCKHLLQLPGEDPGAQADTGAANRCACQLVWGEQNPPLPVRVQDLAERQLAAHPQVSLMLC